MLNYRIRIILLPHLDYADVVWGDQPRLKSEMEKLQSFQNKFARKIKIRRDVFFRCSEVSELAPSSCKTSFSPMYRRRKGNQRKHSATF